MSKSHGEAGKQALLFSSTEPPDLFHKAVQVLHSKPRSPLSLLERKIGNAWIKNALESIPDEQGWFEMPRSSLITDVGYESRNWEYLREACESLMHVVFEWDVVAESDKRAPWKASVLFPEVEIHKTVVRYQISSQILTHLVNPKVYAILDMAVMRRFRRSPTVGIWEFCVRYQDVGLTSKQHWEAFRDMVMGESKDKKTYSVYKYFKSKILVPALAEINAEADHKVELIEHKVGRTIDKIQFAIERKRKPNEGEESAESIEVVAEMTRFGVPRSEARKLNRAYGAGKIREALAYVRKRMADKKAGPIENPPAYLRHALKNGYGASAVSETAASPVSKEVEKKVDFKAMYMANQNAEAERYFQELEPEEQEPLIVEYNAQQSVAMLRIKQKRLSKAASTAFYEWVGLKTWGEPSAEALLEYAQSITIKQN